MATKRKQYNPYTLSNIRKAARAALASMVATGRCPDCGSRVCRSGNTLDCPNCDGVQILRARAEVVAVTTTEA